MKKKSTLKLILSALLGIFLLMNINAQTWTVYDGAKVLTDGTNSTGSAWSIGDKLGTNTTYTINTDGLGNSSLAMVADSANHSSSKSPSLTDATWLPDNATLMFRAKSNNTGITASDFGIMLEFYSFGAVGASNRFEIRIFGGDSLKLSNASVPKYSLVGLNLREYHIYRITVETGNIYKVYLDENPTAICSGVSSLATSTNKMIIRTGSYQSNTKKYSLSGEFDWIAWDTTAVYPAGQGTLPAGVISKVNKLDSKQYTLSPNPVTDKISISNASGINKFEIIDINGKIISKEINKNSLLTANVNTLKAGIYFIKLYYAGKTEQIKFIKK